MPDSFNKFNSKSGFEFNIDNILSKIRLDFNTNVTDPENYILGINSEQTEFILIDPSLINNTNNVENTFDLASLDRDMLGKVNHYVFEKLVDPSQVGCINCDENTDINVQFIQTGDIPILNKEVIAEFEVNPNAVHSLEIELVGHRKVCDENGNCFDKFTTDELAARTNQITLNPSSDIPSSSPFKDMLQTDKDGLFGFPDYSCCPCCDAFDYYTEKYIGGEITLQQSLALIDSACEQSNQYIEIDGVVLTKFSQYCLTENELYVDELSETEELISKCELIRRAKKNYGSHLDPSLLSCSLESPQQLQVQSFFFAPGGDSVEQSFFFAPGGDPVDPIGTGCVEKCITSKGKPVKPPCNGGIVDCVLTANCEVGSSECEYKCCCVCLTNTSSTSTTATPTTPTTATPTTATPTTPTTATPTTPTTATPTTPTTATPTTPTTATPTTPTTISPTTIGPTTPTTPTTATPTTPTTAAPTTPAPPGWSCVGDICEQDDTSTCLVQEDCCNCSKWVCDPKVATAPGQTHACRQWIDDIPTECGRPLFDTLNDCLNADRDSACGSTYDCVDGKCTKVFGCSGRYPSENDCIINAVTDGCGKYQCLSTTSTCVDCSFIPNTDIGYGTKQECNDDTVCGEDERYNCAGSRTCPSGRIIGGSCTPVCSGGTYNSIEQCRTAGCENEDFGPRWICNSGKCQHIDPCDGDGVYHTLEECQQVCGGFSCINNNCVREEGGVFASREQCALTCGCIVYLNMTGGPRGCSECQYVCGEAKRKENGGPCTGCDDGGFNCEKCENEFDFIVNCELFRQNNDLIPHTCTGSICVPTELFGDDVTDDEDPISGGENCGNFCSQSECETFCKIPSGYNCIRSSPGAQGKCIPDYCGNGQFRTYEECKIACAAAPTCGYNCVPSRTNPKINVCQSACASVQTDEGTQFVGSNPGMFRTYEECQTFCTTDYGWACKGNNCVKATEPGGFATYEECLNRCIIPNQAPCGVLPRIVSRR